MTEIPEETIAVKDEDINFYLLSLKIVNVGRTAGEDDGKMYLIWPKSEEVEAAIDRWQTNKPAPIRDFRDVIAGRRIYQSNLHAHLAERNASK